MQVAAALVVNGSANRRSVVDVLGGLAAVLSRCRPYVIFSSPSPEALEVKLFYTQCR
jgi:hypothetical protein